MDTREDKVLKLKALGARRRAESFDGYSGKYRQIGEYHGRKYETEWVSPITKSAHNVHSPLFLVLHTWWADEGLSGPFLPGVAAHGYEDTPTDARLLNLLQATYGKSFGDVFITNLWPFVKPPDPPSLDYDRAFLDYCWPQIEIVAPQLVVCLGKPVSETFRRNQRGPRWGVGEHFLANGFHVYYQSHPGDRPNHATKAEMLSAWAEMKTAVELQWPSQDVNGGQTDYSAEPRTGARLGASEAESVAPKPKFASGGKSRGSFSALDTNTPTLGVCLVDGSHRMPAGWWGWCRPCNQRSRPRSRRTPAWTPCLTIQSAVIPLKRIRRSSAATVSPPRTKWSISGELFEVEPQ